MALNSGSRVCFQKWTNYTYVHRDMSEEYHAKKRYPKSSPLSTKIRELLRRKLDTQVSKLTFLIRIPGYRMVMRPREELIG